MQQELNDPSRDRHHQSLAANEPILRRPSKVSRRQHPTKIVTTGLHP